MIEIRRNPNMTNEIRNWSYTIIHFRSVKLSFNSPNNPGFLRNSPGILWAVNNLIPVPNNVREVPSYDSNHRLDNLWKDDRDPEEPEYDEWNQKLIVYHYTFQVKNTQTTSPTTQPHKGPHFTPRSSILLFLNGGGMHSRLQCGELVQKKICLYLFSQKCIKVRSF